MRRSITCHATGIAALFILYLATSLSFAAAPSSSAPTLKKEWKGIVDCKGKTTNPDIEDLAIISPGGSGMSVSWAELEPKEGQYDFGVIDKFMDSHPGKNFCLRIFCGKKSPAWLMEKAGKVTLKVKEGGYNGSYDVPRWWTDTCKKAYDELQRNLAAKYDNDERLLVVPMSACMTYYAEPFMRFLREDAFNAKALCDAGFTFDADLQAQRDCFQSHANHWLRTRSSISLNPYDQIISAASYRQNNAITLQLMDDAARILGDRAIFQNNSIRTYYNKEKKTWVCSMSGGDYGAIFAKMKNFAQQGRVIGFQTAFGKAIGDTAATWKAAIDYGAQFIEAQPGFDKALSPEQIHQFDAMLENGEGIKDQATSSAASQPGR